MPVKRSFNNVNPEEAGLLAEYEKATGKKVSKGAGWGNKIYGGTNDAGFREWKKSGMATPQKGMDAGRDRFNAMMANRSQNPVLGQTQAGMSGFDKFQAMQAARKTGKNQAGATRFNESMNVNPLVLQQLQQMQAARAQQPQLQMRPQFNAFGFGAQPGLAAQGGQGGSMLANISSQGMNQLAAGQQNNPTIFKAKS